MNASTRAESVNLQSIEVAFEINGRAVTGYAHETILDIAKRNGVQIPHLCHKRVSRRWATAGSAWWRSTVSGHWPPPAVVIRQTT